MYWSSGKVSRARAQARKSIKSSALNLPRLRVRRENAAWHDVRERDVREQREVPHMNLTGGDDGNEKMKGTAGTGSHDDDAL